MANTTRKAGPILVGTISIPWTSDSGGAATVAIAAFRGYIRRFVTDPAAAGDAPTDNYDITITDANGADVLAGTGADRDTANSESVTPAQAILVDGALSLVVANAGNAKSGTVVLYIGEN